MSFIKQLKKTLEKYTPFIALGIFIMLCVLAVLLYQENQITKEISKECGWGEEDWFCECEKSLAYEMRNNREASEQFDFNNIKIED